MSISAIELLGLLFAAVAAAEVLRDSIQHDKMIRRFVFHK